MTSFKGLAFNYTKSDRDDCLHFLTHIPTNLPRDTDIADIISPTATRVVTSRYNCMILEKYFRYEGDNLYPVESWKTYGIVLNGRTFIVSPIKSYYNSGSMMFFVKGFFGCLLFTGYLCQDVSLMEKGILKLIKDKKVNVDYLFIDSTYLEVNAPFSNADGIINMLTDLFRSDKFCRYFLHVPCFGMEDILAKVAANIKELLVIDEGYMEVLEFLGYSKYFTTQDINSRIRIVSKMIFHKKNREKEPRHLIFLRSADSFVQVFKPYVKQNVALDLMAHQFTMYGHCNYFELDKWLKAISATQTVPLYLTESDKSYLLVQDDKVPISDQKQSSLIDQNDDDKRWVKLLIKDVNSPLHISNIRSLSDEHKYVNVKEEYESDIPFFRGMNGGPDVNSYNYPYIKQETPFSNNEVYPKISSQNAPRYLSQVKLEIKEEPVEFGEHLNVSMPTQIDQSLFPSCSGSNLFGNVEVTDMDIKPLIKTVFKPLVKNEDTEESIIINFGNGSESVPINSEDKLVIPIIQKVQSQINLRQIKKEKLDPSYDENHYNQPFSESQLPTNSPHNVSDSINSVHLKQEFSNREVETSQSDFFKHVVVKREPYSNNTILPSKLPLDQNISQNAQGPLATSQSTFSVKSIDDINRTVANTPVNSIPDGLLPSPFVYNSAFDTSTDNDELEDIIVPIAPNLSKPPLPASKILSNVSYDEMSPVIHQSQINTCIDSPSQCLSVTNHPSAISSPVIKSHVPDFSYPPSSASINVDVQSTKQGQSRNKRLYSAEEVNFLFSNSLPCDLSSVEDPEDELNSDQLAHYTVVTIPQGISNDKNRISPVKFSSTPNTVQSIAPATSADSIDPSLVNQITPPPLENIPESVVNDKKMKLPQKLYSTRPKFSAFLEKHFNDIEITFDSEECEVELPSSSHSNPPKCSPDVLSNSSSHRGNIKKLLGSPSKTSSPIKNVASNLNAGMIQPRVKMDFKHGKSDPKCNPLQFSGNVDHKTKVPYRTHGPYVKNKATSSYLVAKKAPARPEGSSNQIISPSFKRNAHPSVSDSSKLVRPVRFSYEVSRRGVAPRVDSNNPSVISTPVVNSSPNNVVKLNPKVCSGKDSFKPSEHYSTVLYDGSNIVKSTTLSQYIDIVAECDDEVGLVNASVNRKSGISAEIPNSSNPDPCCLKDVTSNLLKLPESVSGVSSVKLPDNSTDSTSEGKSIETPTKNNYLHLDSPSKQSLSPGCFISLKVTDSDFAPSPTMEDEGVCEQYNQPTWDSEVVIKKEEPSSRLEEFENHYVRYEVLDSPIKSDSSNVTSNNDATDVSVKQIDHDTQVTDGNCNVPDTTGNLKKTVSSEPVVKRAKRSKKGKLVDSHAANVPTDFPGEVPSEPDQSVTTDSKFDDNLSDIPLRNRLRKNVCPPLPSIKQTRSTFKRKCKDRAKPVILSEDSDFNDSRSSGTAEMNNSSISKKSSSSKGNDTTQSLDSSDSIVSPTKSKMSNTDTVKVKDPAGINSKKTPKKRAVHDHCNVNLRSSDRKKRTCSKTLVELGII